MMDLDRRRGILIGLAVGDAMGASVEFAPPGTFLEVTDFRAGGPHGLEAGEWTDDTSMALALADSIAEAGWDLNDQAELCRVVAHGRLLGQWTRVRRRHGDERRVAPVRGNPRSLDVC
jgi:ADP-ribosylglycohydrolase